jgi:F-type H+-transporting ATPase subunit delta
MKITKEARRAARKYYRSCFSAGRLDEGKVRNLISTIAAERPRHHLGILSEIERFVRTETQKNTLTIETPFQIDEQQFGKIHSQVQKHFPAPLIGKKKVTPTLIGGLRIKVGSNVWDGSVAAKLQQLANHQ